MKLNTSAKIKELDGSLSKELTIGKALANIILFIKSDPLRSYLMATQLYSSDEFELSDADYTWVKTAVAEHGSEVYVNALVSGQILLALSELKDKSKK